MPRTQGSRTRGPRLRSESGRSFQKLEEEQTSAKVTGRKANGWANEMQRESGQEEGPGVRGPQFKAKPAVGPRGSPQWLPAVRAAPHQAGLAGKESWEGSGAERGEQVPQLAWHMGSTGYAEGSESVRRTSHCEHRPTSVSPGLWPAPSQRRAGGQPDGSGGGGN